MFRLTVLATFVLGAIFASDADFVLAPGKPPLTRGMVRQLAAVFEQILDFKFTSDQYRRFEAGNMRYWQRQDAAAIQTVLTNLKYAGHADELASLRRTSQQVLVDSFRADQDDPASAVLVEAYDAAHPQADRRRKGPADLAGTWKRSDGLMADRYRDGRTVGVSYTDSAALEIMADGQFKYIKVHNHCSGGSQCCRLDGSTEIGRISLDGPRLIFDVQSGSQIVEDGCTGQKGEAPVKPRRESYPWSLRMQAGVSTLCWNTASDAAVCFAKERQ